MRAECGGVTLTVGFFLPWEDVCAALAFEQAEESHEEDRFDPKTGRKSGTETVVDREGGRYLRFEEGGRAWYCPEDSKPYDLDDEEAFLEELGARAGCGVATFGGGETWYVSFNLVGDSCEVPGTSYDPHSDWSAGRALSLSKLVEMTSSFKGREVRDRLEGMGLKVGEVLVFPEMTVQD